jgi:hypothetical protein
MKNLLFFFNVSNTKNISEVISIPIKNLNIDLPYDPELHSWGYTERNATQVTPESPTQPCLLQRYSQ